MNPSLESSQQTSSNYGLKCTFLAQSKSLAPWGACSIEMRLSSVSQSLYSNDFSNTAGLLGNKLYMQPLGVGKMKFVKTSRSHDSHGHHIS